MTVEGHKILVVDDNERIREILDRFLRKKGFAPLCVESGEEALKVFPQAPWKVVILDIKLPGIDGFQTLKRLRESGAQTPVIMITGCKEGSFAEEAKKLGAYDFITKPFDLEYLEMCLMAKIATISP